MRTPLSGAERVVLSSSVGRSVGKAGDLFSQLENGELTLTNERLVFESATSDEDMADQVAPLNMVGSASAGSIKLFELVPMYACLEVRFIDGRTERYGVVRSGATKPAEWAGAINTARSALTPELVDATQASRIDTPGIEPLNRSAPANGASIADPLPWIIAVVPLVGAVTEFMIGSRVAALGTFGLFLVYLAVNTALCLHDRHRLRNEGHSPPKTWAVFLVPVYLWKRAMALGRSQAPTLVWLACFAASFFIASQGEKATTTETACSVVTQIIQTQLNGTTSCKRVSISEDLGSGFVTGRAVLDNGREIRITIEQRGREVYVQIPPQ